MAQASPPKPWERRSGLPATSAAPIPSVSAQAPAPPPPPTTVSAPTAMTATSSAPHAPSSATTSSSAPPPLPSRPANLPAATATMATTGYSPYNNARFGATYGGYGGLGGAYGGYSSPYSRFGGMGGYGGGMYGGMGGMGGLGYGGYGYGSDPNDPNSLMRGMESSTAATFQMIESIVGAFGGFAQMLESTFMATHSSFFAMVQVAEQFGNLRNTLGQILGIFTVMRWARIALAKLTGRPLPAGDLSPASFAAFNGGHDGAVGPNGKPLPRPSKKPFFFFVLAVFGLPYLMGKLIRTLASKQEEEHRRQLAAAGLIDPVTGAPIPGATPMAANPNAPMDPSNLEFARVKFDYTPEGTQAGVDLEVKKGDLVAILGKTDPMGNPSQWWRCRARDSRIGYLPSPYLEIIVRRPKTEAGPAPARQGQTQKVIEGIDASRAATMNSSVSAPVLGTTKPGDITLESFQKSQFFS
ncbi:Peroxin 13, N-terminal region-domain-containing protein [Kalaharituber pfeilii]|nr:Peroxin 13, N-terminal region-domain-containing protein [Kalaharituber pfeilii]